MREVKDQDGNPFITEEEYNEAVAEVEAGLKFDQGEFISFETTHITDFYHIVLLNSLFIS